MTLDLWPKAIAAALGVAALVAPMRVAVLAWLLLVNFDMSGRDFAADSAIGGLNAAKAVGIPLVLLWRTRRLRLPELEAAAPFAAFAALILYAALATLWSPYPLAGVKLVGNLVGVALGAVVLARCFAAGVVTSPMLVACLVGSIAVAVGQTFITADQSFGFSRSVGTARFTSFTASQQFAAWVVVLTAAVLALRTRLATGWLVASVAGAVLMANGSRTWLVCYAAILASFALVKLRSMARMVSIMLLAVVVLGGLLMSSLDANQGGEMGGVARIQAVLSASREGGAAMLMTIDTIGWRFVLYEELVYALQESSPGQLLFGHGTDHVLKPIGGGIYDHRSRVERRARDHADAGKTGGRTFGCDQHRRPRGNRPTRRSFGARWRQRHHGARHHGRMRDHIPGRLRGLRRLPAQDRARADSDLCRHYRVGRS
jgi:hypothetical protein